jgi:hypothetical protein
MAFPKPVLPVTRIDMLDLAKGTPRPRSLRLAPDIILDLPSFYRLERLDPLKPCKMFDGARIDAVTAVRLRNMGCGFDEVEQKYNEISRPPGISFWMLMANDLCHRIWLHLPVY